MSWESELRRRYGLVPADYDALRDAQAGVCVICERMLPGHAPRLAVDHEHRSGLIRGLLCTRCNHQFLGMFGEDPWFYWRAHRYLVDSPAKYVIGYRYVPDSPGAAGLLEGN